MKIGYFFKVLIIKIIFFVILGLNIHAQNVFVKGNIKNINISLLTFYRKPNAVFSFVPNNRISSITVSKKGDFILKSELYTPEEWFLEIGTQKVTLFVQPRDTLELLISMDKQAKLTLIIKGLHSKEQQIRQKMYEVQQKKQPSFLSLQDSLFEEYPSWEEIGVDYTEMDKLDSTFLKFYETNMSYFPLYAKIRDKRRKPDSLFLNDTDAALYSPHYNACLMAYLKRRDTTGLTFSSLALRYPLILRFEVATQTLTGKVRDAALSQILANALNEGGWVGDSLYLRYQNSVYSMEYRWIMRNFTADIFRSACAEKGRKIQIFEEKYGQDWQQIFQKYPHKTLYIDIWQANCRPCLYEMEQSLFWQKQYEQDSLVFIFLYLGKEKRQWKKLLQTNNICGQHYYINAPKYLDKWLTLEKGSNALPHYLIIGKDGNYISKNAPFPDGEKWKSVMQNALK